MCLENTSDRFVILFYQSLSLEENYVSVWQTNTLHIGLGALSYVQIRTYLQLEKRIEVQIEYLWSLESENPIYEFC